MFDAAADVAVVQVPQPTTNPDVAKADDPNTDDPKPDDANGASANAVRVANGGRVRNPTWSDANPDRSHPVSVQCRVLPLRRHRPSTVSRSRSPAPSPPPQR